MAAAPGPGAAALGAGALLVAVVLGGGGLVVVALEVAELVVEDCPSSLSLMGVQK